MKQTGSAGGQRCDLVWGQAAAIAMQEGDFVSLVCQSCQRDSSPLTDRSLLRSVERFVITHNWQFRGGKGLWALPILVKLQ